MAEYYIGLMSGTSMDALDAVLVDFSVPPLQILATHSRTLPDELRQQLLTLATPGENELERAAQADILFARFSAETVNALLATTTIPARQIQAIGSHGQTIRHGPDANPAYTVQIGDGNTLAQVTGITTIADFRRRDMVVGGQGAPLVPAFHQSLFQSSNSKRVILNIGGMSNISILSTDPEKPAGGFDTGPGNVLMDGWIQHCRNETYDHNGTWARSGILNNDLLEQLLADPYFTKAPPKSTGREHFNQDWLQAHLSNSQIDQADVQATLCELTARSIVSAIGQHASGCRELLVCGGGAENGYLMERLTSLLPTCQVHSTANYGLDPRWVEAAAFAWLARQTLNSLPGNLPAVTGAREAVILGAIYPAPPFSE
jgi:anhydro-N-acetylmuramic acid kinase